MGAGNCSACSNSFGLTSEAAAGEESLARLREEGSQSLIRRRGGKKVKTRFVCRDFSTSWDALWGAAAAAGRGDKGEMERVMLSASAAMLLLLSGDVETNPGPIGRSKSREPKPDPKKIMEEKVG